MPVDTKWSVAWSPIYDYNEVNRNLFVQDMGTMYSAIKSVNSRATARAMLGINKSFSAPQLDVLGHTATEVTAEFRKYDEEPVEQYLVSKGLVDPVVDLATDSMDRKMLGIAGAYGAGIKFITVDGYIAVRFSSETDDYYYVAEGLTGGSIDCNLTDDGGPITDNCTVTCVGGQTHSVAPAKEALMVRVEGSEEFFAVPMQDSFTYTTEEAEFFAASYVSSKQVQKDNMIYACNNLFGFRHTDIFKSIEESIDETDQDTNIESMFLTYAISMKYAEQYDDEFPGLADELKAFYMGKTLKMTVDQSDITYGQALFGSTETRHASIMILPKGEKHGDYTYEVTDPVDDNDTTGVPLMIPLEIIEKYTISQKYKLKRWTLSFVTNIVHKEKLKWYQTAFFRALTWVIAAVWALLGNPMMLIAMIGSEIISMIDNPWIKLAATIALVMVGGYYGMTNGTLSLTSQLGMATKIISSIRETFFQVELGKLQTEMEEIHDEEQKLKEQIAAMKRDILLLPMEKYNTYFYSMFDLLYNFPDIQYEAATSPPKLPATIPGA